MDSDYPAAHSMDTEWFAVDRDGRVGYFESGENGPVPEGYRDEGDIDGLFNHLQTALVPSAPRDNEAFLASVGLFVFTYRDDSELLEPYTRNAEPERPIHVDQLPPGFRDQCRRVRFPVSFAEVTAVQPCEHVGCSFWGDAAGYLGSDGKTLRPFPGREEEYRAFWEEYYRLHYPEAARELHFEGDAPPSEGK